MPFYVTLFSNFKQNKQFFKEGKNNSENLPRILLKFSLKFSLNFHYSIFEEKLLILSNPFVNLKLTYIQIEREKKSTKIYRSFDGRDEKRKILDNFGKFGLFLEL